MCWLKDKQILVNLWLTGWLKALRSGGHAEEGESGEGFSMHIDVGTSDKICHLA